MPVNRGQNPLIPFVPTSGSMTFATGRVQGHGLAENKDFPQGLTKHSGIFYAYSMDSAPVNIFENRVIPMGSKV